MWGVTQKLLRIIQIIAIFAAVPTAAVAQSANCSRRIAMWEFFADPTLNAAQQQGLRDATCSMVGNVEKWAKDNGWDVPTGLNRLKIFVGDHYRLGRALVPAWESDRGRIEFPASKVNDVLADIAHEFTHYYFPNGNRMLAEGLAVYVQDETQGLPGGNPGYPNFGIPVHTAMKCHPHVASPILPRVDLSKLDQFLTPRPLTLDPAAFADLEDDKRDQWSYVVAGSFVRFLIETHGMDKFRTLYKATPFEAGRKIRRATDNWSEIYSPKTLQSLEADWKAMIDAQTTNCMTTRAMPH
jgi:hypothetical protein